MRTVDIIAKKRDGGTLSAAELDGLIQGYVAGDVPDYQMAAWAMAVVWRGMTDQETIDLTLSMVRSGRTLELSSVAPLVVDKHSTGGVGDKTTLIVAPLVAALGLPVVKMSGRGLGFSGGTLDKLEAIPGFDVTLSVERLLALARAHGIALAGQSADLVPADGKLYALRDVTATVPSLPLIASSIMSKKIAGGAGAIVLDVKVGHGAFMETQVEARRLAELMREIGAGVGKRVTAVLSDMSQPLGNAVGNALEVREAIETLQGKGPERLVEHCLAIGAEMLVLGGRVREAKEGRALCRQALEQGLALAKFREWVAAQDGDARVIEELDRLPRSPVQLQVLAPQAGYVEAIDAREVGLVAVELGAGRRIKSEPIDPAVGIVLATQVGAYCAAGDPLLAVHARTVEDAEQAGKRLLKAFHWSDLAVLTPPPILQVMCD